MNIFNPPPPPNATVAAIKPPVTLLTLPRVDLVGPSNAATAPLSLLLQLPLHWTVDDFIQHHSSSNEEPNTYFVSSRHEPSQQVACVVESKGASFAVHRVETSNVLILVPPHAPGRNGDATNADDMITDDCHDVATDQQHSTTITQHRPAQLLKTGGSGAFFLELRPRRLRRADLRAALPSCDPSSATSATPWIGWTVRDLAGSLQVSQREVQRVLTQIQAFPVRRTDPTQYALLTDSMVQDCYHAVVDGLILCGPPSEDYAGVGIEEAASFVDFVVQNVFSDDERFPDLDGLIHHCLRSLQTAWSEDDPKANSRSASSHQQRYILDVAKVRPALKSKMNYFSPLLNHDRSNFCINYTISLVGGPNDRAALVLETSGTLE
jgi:Sister chromatid cohesion protein Dcc1